MQIYIACNYIDDDTCFYSRRSTRRDPYEALLFDRLTDRVNRDLHETYGDWGNGRRSEDRCIDGVAANCRAAGNNERDRRSTIIHTRACKAIEQRMIQFVRPMSLSGGTPCHGVQRARAQIGFDLTPRVLPRITH